MDCPKCNSNKTKELSTDLGICGSCGPQLVVRSSKSNNCIYRNFIIYGG